VRPSHTLTFLSKDALANRRPSGLQGVLWHCVSGVTVREIVCGGQGCKALLKIQALAHGRRRYMHQRVTHDVRQTLQARFRGGNEPI
jgi:hypothetical protein